MNTDQVLDWLRREEVTRFVTDAILSIFGVLRQMPGMLSTPNAQSIPAQFRADFCHALPSEEGWALHILDNTTNTRRICGELKDDCGELRCTSLSVFWGGGNAELVVPEDLQFIIRLLETPEVVAPTPTKSTAERVQEFLSGQMTTVVAIYLGIVANLQLFPVERGGDAFDIPETFAPSSISVETRKSDWVVTVQGDTGKLVANWFRDQGELTCSFITVHWSDSFSRFEIPDGLQRKHTLRFN